ncbi:MAG: YabP/YqfC family sporulation protein [Lachnospiraceae bacterium]|nr:YabP/YqfC family sporulation protein [Lachnospiraceae bacterium]
MKKLFRPFRMAAVEEIQIPSEIVNREALLTFFGHRELNIENYHKVVCFRETYLKLSLGSGFLEIYGNHLHMTYFSREELHIAGNISEIHFEDFC